MSASMNADREPEREPDEELSSTPDWQRQRKKQRLERRIDNLHRDNKAAKSSVKMLDAKLKKEEEKNASLESKCADQGNRLASLDGIISLMTRQRYSDWNNIQKLKREARELAETLWLEKETLRVAINKVFVNSETNVRKLNK